ncbi:hypothetical protein CANARDRAFT_60409 [[Candida] arabinofermentans NRRL YB-2248]|uniref:HTH La-type RNA-binding domain-containing protein n=1 Tax=[Candida] arabinofermentans NRRL YB-2248 TaxID=983967 RepID=A0A1E4SYF3_9ASCO|nr:hypothetical protein CANARDRAFT_60409 [[Candida] arabinofermentans NRRL YB-2248]
MNDNLENISSSKVATLSPAPPPQTNPWNRLPLNKPYESSTKTTTNLPPPPPPNDNNNAAVSPASPSRAAGSLSPQSSTIGTKTKKLGKEKWIPLEAEISVASPSTNNNKNKNENNSGNNKKKRENSQNRKPNKRGESKKNSSSNHGKSVTNHNNSESALIEDKKTLIFSEPNTTETVTMSENPLSTSTAYTEPSPEILTDLVQRINIKGDAGDGDDLNENSTHEEGDTNKVLTQDEYSPSNTETHSNINRQRGQRNSRLNKSHNNGSNFNGNNNGFSNNNYNKHNGNRRNKGSYSGAPIGGISQSSYPFIPPPYYYPYFMPQVPPPNNGSTSTSRRSSQRNSPDSSSGSPTTDTIRTIQDPPTSSPNNFYIPLGQTPSSPQQQQQQQQQQQHGYRFQPQLGISQTITPLPSLAPPPQPLHPHAGSTPPNLELSSPPTPHQPLYMDPNMYYGPGRFQNENGQPFQQMPSSPMQHQGYYQPMYIPSMLPPPPHQPIQYSMPTDGYSYGEEKIDKLVKQIEYYFSIENLLKDVYLRKHMNSEGYVSVTFIANFARVKVISEGDMNSIIEAIKRIDTLQVSGSGKHKKIRLREGWDRWVLASDQRDVSENTD